MGKIRPTYDVGYKGKSKTGEVFEVIKYEGRKNITIRFNCGLEKNTTSTHIKKGLVVYCKKPIRYEVGLKVFNCRGEEAEIVSLNRDTKETFIKFPSGKVKKYYLPSVQSGKFSEEDRVKIRQGDIFPTQNHGEVEVIEYKNALNILVRFKDGTETYCQASSLRLGHIGHPMSGLYVGYTFTNKEGFTAKVLEYISPYKVELEWEEGGVTEAQAANIKSRSVYYPNHKSVCGVGYFGIGRFKPNKSGRGESNYKQRVYDSWQRMIRRCYDEKEQQKPSSKAYRNVKVCDDWHNFQNFAEWAKDKLDKFEEGWELDKDMFGNGVLYSPENCTLLPSKVNWFLCDSYSNKTSGLPEGVNIITPKPDLPNSSTGYVARCHINGERKYLGFYKTPEEAAEVYCKAKKEEAVRLAEEFKDLLTEIQYNKLKNFTLQDIHRKKQQPKEDNL